MNRTALALLITAFGITPILDAQTPAPANSAAPSERLDKHDFFYAGESGDRKMFIVKKGRIVWSFDNPQGRGEISDATLLSDGRVLYAHQFAIELIAADKSVLWRYDAPDGCEIHTGQLIGTERVLFIQNGPTPKLLLSNITSGKIEREWPLTVGEPSRTHGQFRHARLTEAGTLLVAHMDADKVVEYEESGREIWSVKVENPWSASRLKNGHTLITSGKNFVREVDSSGTTVWEWTPADAPGYAFSGLQIATRLANGHTLINNWASPSPTSIQAIEVTPEKRIVWVLRAASAPVDLGPSTTIQLLDEPSISENVHFGGIR